MAVNFDWKRFWCPRGETINLADRGYLSDPESEWGKYLNSRLITLPEMNEPGCVVLLGEPGIGKTWDLARQYEELRPRVAASSGRILQVDLRSYADESRLMRALFESEEFGRWREGDYVLHVFLDSLDECLMRMDSVATLLADELPKQPLTRLRLRITCRTAPWPGILENALRELFPEFQSYEMAPLRRKDVRAAAEKSGVKDVDDFLERISGLEATSLAIKPVTLKFLISTVLREGEFPADQLALYEKGCRILCEEQNESRRGAQLLGQLTPEERLAVAARIAGVTQFANRDAVFVGRESDGVPPEDVFLQDLAGGVEHGPDEFPLSVDAIRETLDTGLFSSRGQDRLGWAHQTYAEFLAALYCKRHQMPAEQVRSLLFHPGAGGQNLIPQLRDLASWASALNPCVFDAIAAAEPEALLGSAAANLSDGQREALVKSILARSVSGRSFELRFELFAVYPKLKHPGLSSQLRPYLTEKTHPARIRTVCADIARACGLEDLSDELATAALDKDEDLPVRTIAAVGVAEFGSLEAKKKLSRLAFGQEGEDPEDELKGAALDALWPDQISLQEILPLLQPPKDEQLHGRYSSFLGTIFIQRMSARDLPAALRWAAQQRDGLRFGPLDRTMDELIERAWNHLDEPNVPAQFAEVILARMQTYDSLVSATNSSFGKSVEEDSERRHKVLSELLPRLSAERIPHLVTFQPRLLFPRDFEWLLERVLSGSSLESREVEAKLIFQVFDDRSRDAVERLWYACQQNAILKAECGSWFGPLALDSEIARVLRQNLALQKAARQPKFLDPPPPERVKARLGRFESGETEQWVSLVCDLTLEPTSQFATLPSLNLTVLPGWRDANTATRERIMSAGIRYLEEGNPKTEEWITTASLPGGAVTGLHALALLLLVAEDRLNSFAPSVWSRWIPALLRYGPMEKDEMQLGVRLLKRAYALVPADVIASLDRVIDSENERSGHFFTSSEIEACWDDRMAQALLQKAGDPALKPEVLVSLLSTLARHGVSGWPELAESLIQESSLDDETRRDRMRAATAALVMNAPDAGWPIVWPIFQRHRQYGKQVIEWLSYGPAGGLSFVNRLTEEQVADLYVWMVENYPIERRRMSGAMSSADTASMFRDTLLEQLKKKSSFAACDAIERIMLRFPEFRWLERHMEEAKVLARAATWQPVLPKQLLALAFDSDRRFVETPQQLMDAILGSLARLQVRLRDELPAVNELWNDANGEFWPKDELALSDHVARHLRDDLTARGIIVNREVEIRRGRAGTKGQKTDIHVDATVPARKRGTYERTTVIVEVKGNWHRELDSAMQTQLRDRYLKDNSCKAGIYLVGWFACDRWRDADGRKSDCPKLSVGEAQRQFDHQAEELSTDGYRMRSCVLDLRLG